MRSVFPLLVPPVVLALGLTACSPEPLASPAPETSTQEAAPVVEEPPTDPDLPSDADLRTYVDALASDSVSSLEAAQDLTEEGSPAANYLIYYLHNVNAEIDAGLNYPETSRIQDLEDGFELCSEVP